MWTRWLVLACVTQACGGTIEPTSGDAAPDVVDASSEDAGFGDAQTYSAAITFENQSQENDFPTPHVDVTADFNANFTIASTCVTKQIGACAIAKCSSDNFEFASAGTLTIAGGPLPSPAALSAVGGFYSDALPPLKTGDVLSVSATGDQVPAFGPESITMPAPINLTTSLSAAPISSKQDFILSWTNGTPKTQVVIFFEGALECTFDGASGSGTIPSAALASLPIGTVQVTWGVWNTTTFTVGPSTMSLTAIQSSSDVATIQ